MDIQVDIPNHFEERFEDINRADDALRAFIHREIHNLFPGEKWYAKRIRDLGQCVNKIDEVYHFWVHRFIYKIEETDFENSEIRWDDFIRAA